LALPSPSPPVVSSGSSDPGTSSSYGLVSVARAGVEELRRAAGWFAAHEYPVEAIRHAQVAGDWALAARLLVSNAAGLYLDGQTRIGPDPATVARTLRATTLPS